MGKGVRLVVVCEDVLHETFARAFLYYKRRFTHRDLDFSRAPPSKGDAKTHVCQEIVKELKALRRFPGERRGLIYLIDADNLEVQARFDAVRDACRQAGIDSPGAQDPVFGFVPRWEIENWLAFLREEQEVDEGSNGYDKYKGRESDIYPLVETLAESCERGTLKNPPQSLVRACKEHERFKAFLQGA